MGTIKCAEGVFFVSADKSPDSLDLFTHEWLSGYFTGLALPQKFSFIKLTPSLLIIWHFDKMPLG